MISNITIPLLGLVDTAVLGHLDSSLYLAAVAIGANLFSFIYFNFGFLRMGTTGLIAQQPYTTTQGKEQIQLIVLRGAVVALIIAAAFWLLKDWIFQIGIRLIGGSAEAQAVALAYSEVRVWGAPATLLNLVIIGTVLGLGKPKLTLILLVITNLTNIILDYWFVIGLNLAAQGVAWATVLANVVSLAVGCFFLWRLLGPFSTTHLYKIIELKPLRQFLSVNSDIFIRTLFLMAVFLLFVHRGAQYGDDILAANAVLITFFFLLSNALDGFANAAEVTVGNSVGEKNQKEFQQAVVACGLLSIVVAALCGFFFWLSGGWLIYLLTDLEPIRNLASEYLPWVWILPFTTVICFLLDGVFIGATQTKAMRNAMALSTFFVFIPLCFLILPNTNHYLWLSLNVFMLARSIFMFWWFKPMWHGSLINSSQ